MQDLKNKEIDQLYEIIKKQALIIEAAGIEYPTINQSIEHIHDIYLQSQGRSQDIGTFTKDQITVEIKVI